MFRYLKSFHKDLLPNQLPVITRISSLTVFAKSPIKRTAASILVSKSFPAFFLGIYKDCASGRHAHRP
jgi:hypothetical protein